MLPELGGILAGQNGGTNQNNIDFVTISSTGTATAFGNIHDHLVRYPTGLSNETRGLLIGGYDGSSGRDELRYVTIASQEIRLTLEIRQEELIMQVLHVLHQQEVFSREDQHQILSI